LHQKEVEKIHSGCRILPLLLLEVFQQKWNTHLHPTRESTEDFKLELELVTVEAKIYFMASTLHNPLQVELFLLLSTLVLVLEAVALPATPISRLRPLILLDNISSNQSHNLS
jgi:hypothetical protein